MTCVRDSSNSYGWLLFEVYPGDSILLAAFQWQQPLTITLKVYRLECYGSCGTQSR